jgi:hypothetical protein
MCTYIKVFLLSLHIYMNLLTLYKVSMHIFNSINLYMLGMIKGNLQSLMEKVAVTEVEPEPEGVEVIEEGMFIYICIHMCGFECVYVYLYIYIYIYIYIHGFVCVCIHVCM